MAKPFTVEDTHGISLREGNEVFAASDGRGWTSIYASTQREVPYEGRFPGIPHPFLVLHLDGPVPVERFLSSGPTRRVIPPRGLFILPGDIEFGVRLEQPLRSLHLYLRQQTLMEVAQQLYKEDAARVEIVPGIGLQDGLIEKMGEEILSCLRQDEDCTTAEYVDYLSLALAARLIREHSTMSRKTPHRLSGRLSGSQLSTVEDFIEENLDSRIDIKALASTVNLPAVCFARRFRDTVGLPPHQFVLKKRFERSHWLLSTSNLSIAEIAYACGFAHQEHLTRVFRRFSGTTPGAFRARSNYRPGAGTCSLQQAAV